MVNFVKHIRAIMYKLEADSRIEAHHVCLYWALFQTWNEHRFQNPMRIYRDEVMARAKIRTRKTYAKCMRELAGWSYFSYEPARHHFEPCLVLMRRFDGGKNADVYAPQREPGSEPDDRPLTSDVRDPQRDPTGEPRDDTRRGTHNINYINNTNIQNNLNDNEQAHPISDFGNDFTHPVQTPGAEEKSDTRGGGAGASDRPGGDGTEAVPASLDEVYPFFAALYSTRVEAEKFYHYFNAKGWRVGEKSPMHNWRSAARHWVLNAARFNPHNGPTPGSLASPGPQNYAEPL
jgi:hypothetical protein